MIGFDDEDRLEAERRWEEVEVVADERADLDNSDNDRLTNPASTSYSANADDNDDEEESLFPDQQEEAISDLEYYQHQSIKLTPSRSSTSLKSILKKSTVSGDSASSASAPTNTASDEVSPLAIANTPARTVTFSPSTLPAAPSPPETLVTPEHPRSHLFAHQGETQPPSPTQHVYVADESLLGPDESREVEEALLSRSISSPSNPSPTPDESTYSLRLQGSASKRGAAFLDRMHASIPSPDTSMILPTNSGQAMQPQAGSEVSCLLDTSVPAQLNQTTVIYDKTHLRISVAGAGQIGHKPLFLRQSTIFEEPSSILSMRPYTQSPLVASLPSSPASTVQDFHSFVTASPMSPLASFQPSVQKSLLLNKALTKRPNRADEEAASFSSATEGGIASAALPLPHNEVEGFHQQSMLTKQEESVFLTPESKLGNEMTKDGIEWSPSPTTPNGRLEGQAAFAKVESKSLHTASCTDQSLHKANYEPLATKATLAPPPITPSSSLSSLIPHNPESPFTSLLSHLLGAQDDLLSHRADQKTLLLSLVANLRGELASRERMLDLRQNQKVASDKEIRALKAQMEQEKLTYRQNLEAALKQVEVTKTKLVQEMKRGQEGVRHELAQETRKRTEAEKQLQEINLEISTMDGMLELKNGLARQQEVARQLELDNKILQESLAMQRKLSKETELAKTALSCQFTEVQNVKNGLTSQLHQLSIRCSKLEEHLSAAEMQITRTSSANEKQLSTLQRSLTSSEAKVNQLRHQLDDTKHALDQMRHKEMNQYSYSASVEDDLRQQNDTLVKTLADFEGEKELNDRELQSTKKALEKLSKEKDAKIARLESEALQRSTDRRKLVEVECVGCGEHKDRTTFLEGETVRLREVVGRMRLESAEREGETCILILPSLRRLIDIALQSKSPA